MKYTNYVPFVSIIILNYNGEKLLLKCLRSVLDFTEYTQFEVLLVDNGSKDDSIKRVRRIFGRSKKLKIVALRKNFGYAEGNNIGYKHISSKAKYVVFLNNDVVVEEGWLRKLITVFEGHVDIGAAQPLIFTMGRINEGVWGEYMDVFGDTRHKFEPESKNGFFQCFCVSGAALIVRRELIDKFGLFNPQYFLNYEETDLC